MQKLPFHIPEYLHFVAGLKGVPKKERRAQVEKSMDRLRIADMRRRLIRNLSKGYKQRVGFAQALLGNPKILILDEPTVGLDPTQVMEVRNLILDLKKEHSVIFSSHILAEVSAVCERVVIINKGEIIAIDTIENLERNMMSDTVLNLTAEGDKEKITRLLKDIQGVIGITEVKQISENRNLFQIELESEKIRNEIMSVLMNNQCSIVEMSLAKLNLEQVFLKLTQTQKKSSLEQLIDETKKANPYDQEE